MKVRTWSRNPVNPKTAEEAEVGPALDAAEVSDLKTALSEALNGWQCAETCYRFSLMKDHDFSENPSFKRIAELEKLLGVVIPSSRCPRE